MTTGQTVILRILEEEEALAIGLMRKRASVFTTMVCGEIRKWGRSRLLASRNGSDPKHTSNRLAACELFDSIERTV